MTTRANFPAWFLQAKDEHLIDEFLADPARFANLDEALSMLPSDRARILYLRGAHKLKVSPDEPAFYQGIVNSVIVSEILQTGVEDFLEKMQQAEAGALGLMQSLSEMVARIRRQAERVETSQSSYESNVGKHLTMVETLSKNLPDQIKTALTELIITVRESMTNDATKALEAAAPNVINERAQVLVTKIDGATKTVVGSVEALQKFTDAVRQIITQEKDVVIGRIKIERWKLKFGSFVATAFFVMGSLMGTFVFQKAGHATIDNSTIREINAGYDFLQAYPNLDPTTRGKIDKMLIQMHQQALQQAAGGNGSR